MVHLSSNWHREREYGFKISFARSLKFEYKLQYKTMRM